MIITIHGFSPAEAKKWQKKIKRGILRRWFPDKRELPTGINICINSVRNVPRDIVIRETTVTERRLTEMFLDVILPMIPGNQHYFDRSVTVTFPDPPSKKSKKQSGAAH